MHNARYKRLSDAELLAWYECGRKVRHPDERAAKTGAHLAGLGHYPCTRCAGWHVGTPPSRHVRPGKILKRARKLFAAATLVFMLASCASSGNPTSNRDPRKGRVTITCAS